ncbi:hypothetical protein LAZ67_15001922 [Cordylochernes scorpioides]|uniref:PDEase domain-containing protein n=1 Tax=Cordylochernes scorpioides TaxID=51811 RepID=A0ABY6L972_9ARAC|nr:hypothetical protein LAZ67_15001922 [Cordylochernes scorpioides]
MAAALQKIDMDPEHQLYTPKIEDIAAAVIEMLLLEAIAMTSCDLCASTKPWDQQRQTVNVIFEEFYEQTMIIMAMIIMGDEEREQGRVPIAMMDRTKLHEQPASQVGFLTGICVPCYQLLHQLIPQTSPFLQGCL